MQKLEQNSQRWPYSIFKKVSLKQQPRSPPLITTLGTDNDIP